MGYGGIDVDDLNEARAERDALRAQLAEVTRERDVFSRCHDSAMRDNELRAQEYAEAIRERDEARAKVARLTLSPLAVKGIRRALDDAANDYANSHSDIDAEIIVEMDRYAETLGGA